MDHYVATFGDENDWHITAGRVFGEDGFEVTIWRGNHGTSGLGVIRDEGKAREIAEYLYNRLLPEYEAERARQKEKYKEFTAELLARPKPKPPRVKKNAPKVDVFECPECQELIAPEDVRDDRVYECGECGTKSTGDDGRRCGQCNKFAAKISDTSCPECDGPMDDAETVQAQQATDGTWVKCEP